MTTELEIEVFRTGDYGPRGRWDGDDLDGIVADYDATLHEAPVTLDHAQEGPALGWVEGLRREGDLLFARLRGINTRLMTLVREGAFKKRSIELYNPLPETGRPYLKAVSFLGAATPAVKGLRDPLFSEAGAPGATYAGGAETTMLDFRTDDPGAVFAEARRALMEAARWRPAWEERGIGDFFTLLAGLDPVELGEGRKLEPAAWFAEFLGTLPPLVATGEAAPAGRDLSSERRHSPAFAARGGDFAPASLILARRAAELQQADPSLDYSSALLLASRE